MTVCPKLAFTDFSNIFYDVRAQIIKEIQPFLNPNLADALPIRLSDRFSCGAQRPGI